MMQGEGSPATATEVIKESLHFHANAAPFFCIGHFQLIFSAPALATGLTTPQIEPSSESVLSKDGHRHLGRKVKSLRRLPE
jgi:hypothetical protein